MESLSPLFETFVLVLLAEFGDKSQLVTMTLAARYKHWPIIIGSVSAFAVLNLLAVVFGATVSHWLPMWLVALIVAVLFIYFGLQSLFFEEDEGDDADQVKVGRQLILSVFMLIFFAELGDKTQLAVAALGGLQNPWLVWLGSTLALGVTTVLGVEVGRKLLQRMPLVWIHRGSGVLFLVMGLVALYQAYEQFVALA
ncbi:TMEM165/GDT1 family protein [Neptunomonas phycophila]|uniref:TMEM165/GDT1 family protein n=1 Tax=Neptunomonas phycophila TaxID=1572645 RepID=UPI0030F53FE9